MSSYSELEDSDCTEDDESQSVIAGTPRKASQMRSLMSTPMSSSTPSESGQSDSDKDDKLPVNPKEWSCAHVHAWTSKIFDEKIADKFLAEEVNGATLLSTSVLKEETMRQLGLNTVGKRAWFEERIKELSHSENQQIDVASKKQKCDFSEIDRVLTNKEKDLLSSKERSLYNTKKTRIINHVKATWPESGPTPKFRHNSTNLQKLHEIAHSLSTDDNYAMPTAGLKYQAISDLIRRHMMERRRKASDVSLLDLSSSMEESVTEQSDTTSSACSSIGTPRNVKYSPPPELYEKLQRVTDYKEQFKKGLSLPSAEAILLKWLNKVTVRDIKLKELKAIAKEMKVKMMRSSDKDTYILAIASILLKQGKCTLTEYVTLDRVTINDVTINK